MVRCFTDDTGVREEKTVTREYIWETLDSLFMTIHRQGQLMEEQQARIADLERRLEVGTAAQQTSPPLYAVHEASTERAA